MKRLSLVLLSVLVLSLLAACGTDSKEEETDSEGIGFSLSNETIEEATNVPEDEKEAILKAFETYIGKMNEKDLDGYMETIAEKPASFTREEEHKLVEEMFEDYDFTREASDVTIVKYNEKEAEAQVFSNLENKVKQLSTGLETKENSRQVTVFIKEKNGWKVSAVHAIGES